MASKRSSERKSLLSLTLNQKLEIIKLNKEGMLKAEMDRNLALNSWPSSKYRLKKFKEIESTTPVNIWMIKKMKQPYCCYNRKLPDDFIMNNPICNNNKFIFIKLIGGCTQYSKLLVWVSYNTQPCKSRDLILSVPRVYLTWKSCHTDLLHIKLIGKQECYTCALDA